MRILGEFLTGTHFMDPAGECGGNLDFVAQRTAMHEAAETTGAVLAKNVQLRSEENFILFYFIF